MTELEHLISFYTSYNREKGKLYWKVSPSSRATVGSEVGSYEDDYLRSQITNSGIRYRFSLHKAVWFWEHGYYPDFMLDHKDFDRSNNKIHNLRAATSSDNNRNRFYGKGCSKYQGVTKPSQSKKWIAQITFNRKCYYLGSYSEEKDAALAYNKKSRELFGEFAFQNTTLEHLRED